MELAVERDEEQQAAAMDAKDVSRLPKRKRADNDDTSEPDESNDDGKEDTANADDGVDKPREVMSRTEHAKLAAAARWKKHKEVKEAAGKSGQEGETLQIRTRSEAKTAPSEADAPVTVKKKPGPKSKGVVVDSSTTLTAEGKVRKKPGPKPKQKVVVNGSDEEHAATMPPVKVHKKPGPKPKPKPSVEVVKVKGKPGRKPKAAVAAVDDKSGVGQSTAPVKMKKKPGRKPKAAMPAAQSTEKDHASVQLSKKRKSLDVEGVEEERVRKKPGPKPKAKQEEVVRKKPGRKPKLKLEESVSPQTKSVTTSKSAGSKSEAGSPQSKSPTERKKPGRKPKSQIEKQQQAANVSAKKMAIALSTARARAAKAAKAAKRAETLARLREAVEGRGDRKQDKADEDVDMSEDEDEDDDDEEEEEEEEDEGEEVEEEEDEENDDDEGEVEEDEDDKEEGEKEHDEGASPEQQAAQPALQLPKLAATEPASAAQELKHGDQEPMTVDQPAGGVEGRPDTGTAEEQAPAMHAEMPPQTAAGGAEQPNIEHQEPEAEPAVTGSAEIAGAGEAEQAPELSEPHQADVVFATPASQSKPFSVMHVEAPAAKPMETSKPSEKRVASPSPTAKANTTNTTTVQTQAPVAVPTLASVLLQFPKRKGPGRPTNAEIAARKAALAAAAAAAGVSLPLPSPPRIKPPPVATEVRDRSERRKIKRPEAADMIMEPLKVDRETRSKEKKLLREMRKDKEKKKFKRKEKGKEKMKLKFKGDEKGKDKDKIVDKDKDKEDESDKEEGDEAEQDGDRRTSSMFPFKKKETVIILGNRRTPSKFNNRRAVVTDVGLNGWYEVRTIDTSEVLRVQYMALKSASKMEKLRAKLKEKKSERDSILVAGEQAVSTPKSPKPGAAASAAALPEMRPASGAALADESTAVPSFTEAAAVAPPSTAATALDEVKEKRQQEVLQFIVQEAVEVEELIPWSHVRKIWRTRRNSWRRNMKHASSLQELGPQLKELRAALLVDPTDARNALTMGDAWEQHLAAITEAEDAEALVALWADLSDGIKQWLALTPVRADGELHLGVLLANNKDTNNIDSNGVECLTLAVDQPAVQEGGVGTDLANTTNNKPTQIKTVRYFASAAAAIVAAATAAAEAVATGKAVELPLESLLSGSADELKAVREALENEREQVAQQLKLLEEQVMNTLTNPRPLSYMDKTRTEAAMNMITDASAATVRTSDGAELPIAVAEPQPQHGPAPEPVNALLNSASAGSEPLQLR